MPSSEIRCANRYATACLTVTFRSQGFSPSQRFGPRTPLRLCFAPHPLIGFRPSELFPPRPAVMPSDTHCSLVIGRTHSPTAWGRGNTTRQPKTRVQTLTPELCSSLASDTPRYRKLWRRAAALLAFLLSEVCRHDGRSENLPSCTWNARRTASCPQARLLSLCYRVLNQSNLDSASEEVKPTSSRFLNRPQTAPFSASEEESRE